MEVIGAVLGSLSQGETLIKTRFAKLLELDAIGPALEVLPHIFVRASAAANPWPVSEPFFSRFVKIKADSPNEWVEITEGLFQASLELLGDRVGTFDLSPGLSWTGDPVGFAALIAASVHLNQQDKLGFPYIEHPRRVFLNSEWSLNPEDLSEAERIAGYQAAWLHDVIEDSAEYFYRSLSGEDLAAWGFESRVVSVVQKLTRPDDKKKTDYYYREILLDTTARAVKLADIADNRAAWRVALLPDGEQQQLASKYDNAQEKLRFEPEKEGDWFELRVEYFDGGPWPLFALPESYQALRQTQSRESIEPQFRKSPPPDYSFEQTLAEINRHANHIINERAWVGLDPSPANTDWPSQWRLEAWYAAYLTLLARAEASLSPREDAEDLAVLIDSTYRDEVNFRLVNIGLIPRDTKSLDVKLRLPRALNLLRAASKEISYQAYSRSTADLESTDTRSSIQLAKTSELLDATVLAFAHDTVPWAAELMKHLVIELLERAGR